VNPATTDPQWYPLADPPGVPGVPGGAWPTPEAAGWSPERRAAYQHAVQQHAAHQQAIQQQRRAERLRDEQSGHQPAPAGEPHRDDQPPQPRPRPYPHPHPAEPL
jgi:hypothetical protein